MRIGLLVMLLFLAGACSSSIEQGVGSYQAGRYGEAVEQLREFVNSHPNDAAANYTLGDALYLKYSDDYARNKAATNNLNLSLLYFSKAIDLSPRFAEAYGQRGHVYLTLGDPQAAKRDYDTAIRFKPGLDRVYYNRGYWYESQGAYAEAVADYRKYISLSQNNRWRDDAARRIESLEMKMKLKAGAPRPEPAGY